MKTKPVLPLLLFLIVFVSCTAIKDTNVIHDNLYKSFPSKDISVYIQNEDLSADIDFLIETIHETNPKPYSIVEKQKFISSLEAIKQQFDSISILEFYKQIAPKVIALNLDHTYVEILWDSFNSFRYGKGRVFPFEVILEKNKIVITKNYSENINIRKGDVIEEINGYRGEEIIQHLLQYCHGSTEYIKTQKRFPVYFSALLWVLYNFDNEYNIVVNNNTYRIAGVEQQFIDHTKIQNNTRENKEFDYFKIENRTGYLLVNNFHQVNFEEKLKSAFKQIQTDSIQNLIIDVSKNTGGNTMQVEQLLNYLTDNPYKTASFILQRRSVQMDKYLNTIFAWWLKPATRIHPLLKQYYKTPIGENAEISMKEKKAKKKSLRFYGNLYVLIGPNNYSAGTEFVSVIKDYKIGKIIGQETGGPANGDGNSYIFILPNSHLRCMSSTNFQIRPDGKFTLGGIKPDININIDTINISEIIDFIN